MADVVDRDVTSERSGYSPGAIKLRCTIGFWEMVGHIVLWIVVTIFTLGVGAFFFAYSVQKMIVNHTELVNRRGDAIAHLKCEFSVVSSIGHVLLWILLTIVTLGLALPFYIYRVNRVVMNETEVVMY